MTDQIIIEFQADTSQLKPAIDMLTQLGQVDKTFAAQLQSGNKDLEKRARGFQSNADAAKKMQTSLGDLSTNAEKLADAFQKGAEAGFAKAMQETSIKIKELEDAIKKLSKTTDDTKKPQQSLRGELREMTAQLTRLKLAGQDNTEEYLRLKNAAGELEDAIGDASDEIRQAGSDTRGLDQALRVTTVVTAGFTALQGAAALFGEENEDVQRAILKVNGALSILNTLQAVQAELARKDSIFTTAAAGAKTLYARAVQFATAQTLAFRVALAALGIGLVIGAIAGLVAIWNSLTSSVKESGDELDNYRKRVDALNASQEQQRNTTNSINKELLSQANLARSLGKEDEANAITKKALNEQIAAENVLLQQNKELRDAALENLRREQRRLELRKLSDPTLTEKQIQKELQNLIIAYNTQNQKVRENITNLNNYRAELNNVGKSKKELKKATDDVSFSLDALFKALAKTPFVTLIEKPVLAAAGSLQNLNERLKTAREQFELLSPNDENFASYANYIGKLEKQIEDLTKKAEDLKRTLDINPENFQLPKEESPDEGPSLAELEAEKQKQDFIKNLSINTSAEILSIIANQRAQARQRELEADLIALDARKSAELGVEGLTAEQRLQIERRFAREAALIRRKQFIAEQNARISETLINSFAAIGRLLVQTPPPNPAFFQGLALIGIQSALAVAQIKAQKPPEIPQFKKGTRYGPGKVSLVGEEGPELKMVERGAKVYTAKQTEKIVNVLSHFPGMADEIVRGNMPVISRPEEMAMQGGVSIDYDKFGKSVAENLRVEQTVVNNNMDADGFTLYVTKSCSSQTIRNQRRRIS